MRAFPAALTALAVLLLAGCAESDDSAPSAAEGSASPSKAGVAETAPGYLESEECRTDGAGVLDTLALALEDEDIRDAAARMAAIEEMGYTPLAQCSSAVTAPAREATTAMNCALDIAMATGFEKGSPGCGEDVGGAMVEALSALREAQLAMDAMREGTDADE